MATWYVNSLTGTAGGAGTSWVTARNTLANVNSLASAGDTIWAHGRFQELLPVKALNWRGFGYCEFNGGGTLTNSVATTLTTWTNIIFDNWVNLTGNVFGAVVHSYTDCTFRNMAYGLKGYDAGTTILCNRCQFYSLTTGIYFNTSVGSNGVNSSIRNCIFYGNAVDAYVQLTTTGFAFTGCVFGSPVMLDIQNNGSVLSSNGWHDYNVFNFATGKNRYGAVDKTTLAAWLASGITAPTDRNSIDRAWTADVGDVASRSLLNTPGSYLNTFGPGSTPVGIPRPALTVSNATNASLWTGGVFSNTVIDGSGNIVLVAGQTIGTAATGVADFGGAINCYGVNIGMTGFDSTHYVDTDPADSPGFLNYELRGSNTIFSSTDSTPAWVTIPIGADVSSYMSPSAFRYWQARITLRGV